MVPSAIGYCDLNISSDSANLKSLVLKALCLGYQTVAINTVYSPPQKSSEGPNKKPKGEIKQLSFTYPVS